MNSIINLFLELPFLVRVAISLFIILILWCILRQILFRVLALIPFLLEKLFIALYCIVETPIAALHKKFGLFFYKIDNLMNTCGVTIDNALNRWFNAWHSPYKFKWGYALIVYLLCVTFIVLPSFIPVKNNILKTGEALYNSGQDFIINLLEKHEYYEPEKDKPIINNEKNEPAINAQKADAVVNEQAEKTEIKLIVSGLKSTLLVRDIPDTENSTTLEKLYNGDIVIWTGELVFANVEDDHIETWAKIVTQNGVEGWSRLLYLQPEDYENVKFSVKISTTK